MYSRFPLGFCDKLKLRCCSAQSSDLRNQNGGNFPPWLHHLMRNSYSVVECPVVSIGLPASDKHCGCFTCSVEKSTQKQWHSMEENLSGILLRLDIFWCVYLQMCRHAGTHCWAERSRSQKLCNQLTDSSWTYGQWRQRSICIPAADDWRNELSG